jgi:TPR repeat protein
MDEQPPDIPPPSQVNEQPWPLERQGESAMVYLRHEVRTGHVEVTVDGQPISIHKVARIDGSHTFLFLLWGRTVQIHARIGDEGYVYDIALSNRDAVAAPRPPARTVTMNQTSMPRWGWLLVACGVIVVLGGLLWGLHESGKLDGLFRSPWKLFTSASGQFRVDVPSTVAEKVDSVVTPNGIVELHTFRTQRLGSEYLIMFSDVKGPAERMDPDLVMTNARDRALRDSGGKLVGDRFIAVGGYPGREFKFETPQGTLNERAFRWKERLYQVIAVSGRFAQADDVTHFLGSFQITGEPAPSEPIKAEPDTTPAPSGVELRGAMVRISGGSAPACGFLVGGGADMAYVLTTSAAVTGGNGRLATGLSLTRVVGDFDTPPVVKAVMTAGALGLAFVRSPLGALPLSMPLSPAAALTPKSQLRVPRCEANGDMATAGVASIRSGHDGIAQLIQLTPTLRAEQSGAPVVDGEGRVVGMADALYQGSGATALVPTERVRELLHGGLRGGGLKYRVADGRCYFEAQVFVENPTGQIRKAGLILEPNRSEIVSEEDPLHPAAIGVSRAQAPVRPAGDALLSAVIDNCEDGFLQYQIELEDTHGETTLSVPHAVHVAATGKEYLRDVIVESGRYGVRPPDMTLFLQQPPARPWGFSFRCKPNDAYECQTECQAGQAASCEELGRMHETGESLPRDVPKAREMFLRSCALGEMTACTRAGNLLYARDARKDAVQAAKDAYRKACDAKEGSGCTGLGDIAADAKEAEKALGFYKQACELKNSDGCTRLGVAYREGHGVARDDAAALKFFERACKGSDATSCAYLGEAYREGRGVPSNMDTAASHYERACRAGDALSCNNLAVLIDRGEVTGGERARVVMLFRQACDLGDKQGCENAKR